MGTWWAWSGCERSARSLGIIGILLAGGVYVPFDVQGQSTEKLARQLDESAIGLLVADQSDEAGDRLPWARRVTIVDASSLEREFMPLFREVKLPHRLPEDPAAVIFNARGHGVLVTHAGIVRLVTSGAVMEFGSSDTVLLHAGAQEHTFQMELWGPLLAGGTVALAPQSWLSSAMPAHEYARVMRRFRVSAICARPTLLEELAKEPLAPLDQVKQAVVDATELAPSLLSRLSGGDRAVRVSGGIGAAETTSLCSERAGKCRAGGTRHAGSRQRCHGADAGRARSRHRHAGRAWRSPAMRWRSDIWDSRRRRWRRLPRPSARTSSGCAASDCR